MCEHIMCCVIMTVANIVPEGPVNAITVRLYPMWHIDGDCMLPWAIHSPYVAFEVLIKHFNSILILIRILDFVIHRTLNVNWCIFNQTEIPYETLSLVFESLINADLSDRLCTLLSKFGFGKLVPDTPSVITSTLDEPNPFDKLWHSDL